MKKVLISTICTAAVLSACGSSNDDTPAVTSQVPASASQSVFGFVSYLKQLVASNADTLEPVDVSAVTPPTTEDAEPAVVD